MKWIKKFWIRHKIKILMIIGFLLVWLGVAWQLHNIQKTGLKNMLGDYWDGTGNQKGKDNGE